MKIEDAADIVWNCFAFVMLVSVAAIIGSGAIHMTVQIWLATFEMLK